MQTFKWETKESILDTQHQHQELKMQTQSSRLISLLLIERV